MSIDNDTIDFMIGVTEDLGPVEVLKQAYRDIRKDIGAFFMAGLGAFIAILFLTIGLCIVSAIPLLPTLMTENEMIALAGMGLSGLLVTICSLVFGFVYAPCYLASLLKGVALHRRQGIPLTFNTVWKYSKENRRDIILVNLAVQLIVSVGILFCIVPGLVLAVLTAYAFPLVVLYRMKPTAAIKASVDQVRAHITWHFSFWVLAAGSMMLFAWIPILGTFLVQPVTQRLLLGATENSFSTAPVGES